MNFIPLPFFWQSLAFSHLLGVLLLRSQIISVNPIFICLNYYLTPLIIFYTNAFGPAFTHVDTLLFFWALTRATYIYGHVKLYVHCPMKYQVSVWVLERWGVDCFFAKYSNRHARTAFQFVALSTISKFGMPFQPCWFFIQALPYMNDSDGFLLDLMRNFRAYSCLHISGTLISTFITDYIVAM